VIARSTLATTSRLGMAVALVLEYESVQAQLLLLGLSSILLWQSCKDKAKSETLSECQLKVALKQSSWSYRTPLCTSNKLGMPTMTEEDSDASNCSPVITSVAANPAACVCILGSCKHVSMLTSCRHAAVRATGWTFSLHHPNPDRSTKT
jgi:hypothetical protein